MGCAVEGVCEPRVILPIYLPGNLIAWKTKEYRRRVSQKSPLLLDELWGSRSAFGLSGEWKKAQVFLCVHRFFTVSCSYHKEFC